METEKYKALLTAVETGSLASAAEKLGYTTSGISRMMASLEEETGLSLLIRSKNGVRPSSTCEEMLPEIQALLKQTEVLNRKESELHGIPVNRIRIGTAYNFYYPALSRTISQFSSVYPDITVEIISGYSTSLMDQLNHHQLDLCISSRREINGNWIPFIKDEMMAAISSQNPLSDRKTVSLSTFAVSPYIQTHPSSDSDSARVFERNGIQPNVRYTTEDSMATFAMVAADLGITMNNHLNCILWHKKDIVMLPVRPKQKTEIGIAISDEADHHVNDFARLLFREMKGMSS